MNHVRELAKQLVKAMDDPLPESIPVEDRLIAADTYRRFAIRDYAEALKLPNERTPEHNQRCLESAYVYAEKAISLRHIRRKAGGCLCWVTVLLGEETGGGGVNGSRTTRLDRPSQRIRVLHVVVGRDPEGQGLRWRPQTESACNTIVSVLGDQFKVLTKEDFISSLQKVVDEDEQAKKEM